MNRLSQFIILAIVAAGMFVAGVLVGAPTELAAAGAAFCASVYLLVSVVADIERSQRDDMAQLRWGRKPIDPQGRQD